MKIYVILKENELMPTAYSSLEPLCKAYGIGYSTAAHGKKLFLVKGIKLEIRVLEVIRISGRGNPEIWKYAKGK